MAGALYCQYKAFNAVSRLAVGTAHGYGIVDYAQRRLVHTKCTLNPAGEYCSDRDRNYSFNSSIQSICMRARVKFLFFSPYLESVVRWRHHSVASWMVRVVMLLSVGQIAKRLSVSMQSREGLDILLTM
jgi:hypothetical protein